MATAAAVHIGRQTGDNVARRQGVADERSRREPDLRRRRASTKGYAFGTPESWFVDDVTICRYTAYTRARSVWQLVDALERLPDPSQSPIAPTAGPR